MKRIIIAACAIIASLMSLDARQHPGKGIPAEHRADRIVERLDKVLKLGPQQERKIRELYLDFFRQTRPGDTVMDSRRELDKKIETILDGKQKQKFARMKRKAQRR